MKTLFDFANINTQYYLDGTRKYNGEDTLVNLFDVMLQEMIKKPDYRPEMIKRDYPIIAFEYDLDDIPPHKYSDEELMERYIHANKVDKKIYMSIIKHRLDPVYNKNHKQCAQKYIELMEKNNIKDENLTKLINDSETMLDCLIDRKKHAIKLAKISLDKYLKLSQDLLNVERSMSKDEFNKRTGR